MLVHLYDDFESVFIFTTEAAASFKAVISGARELLGDAERITGKWTKDDKVRYRMYLVLKTLKTLHRGDHFPKWTISS